MVYGDGFKSVTTVKAPLGFAHPRFESWRLHFLLFTVAGDNDANVGKALKGIVV